MKFSIIVPAYNAEEHIEKCIKSLVNQTYKNLEIVIINDGSTDDTLEICKKKEKIDSRILVINQENKGVSCARNIGIEKSTGEYLLFVDSDDYLELNALKEINNFLSKHKVEILKYNYYRVIGFKRIESNRVFETNKIILKNNYTDMETIYDKIINTSEFSSASTSAYSKKIIGKTRFPENITIGEDHLFNIYLYEKVRKFGFLNKHLYNYVYNSQSATQQIVFKKVEDNIKSSKKVCEYLFDFIKKTDIDYKYNDVLRRYVKEQIYLTSHYVEILNYKDFEKKVKKLKKDHYIIEYLKTNKEIFFLRTKYFYLRKKIIILIRKTFKIVREK